MLTKVVVWGFFENRSQLKFLKSSQSSQLVRPVPIHIQHPEKFISPFSLRSDEFEVRKFCVGLEDKKLLPPHRLKVDSQPFSTPPFFEEAGNAISPEILQNPAFHIPSPPFRLPFHILDRDPNGRWDKSLGVSALHRDKKIPSLKSPPRTSTIPSHPPS